MMDRESRPPSIVATSIALLFIKGLPLVPVTT
jgi:hypothetical protein